MLHKIRFTLYQDSTTTTTQVATNASPIASSTSDSLNNIAHVKPSFVSKVPKQIVKPIVKYSDSSYLDKSQQEPQNFLYLIKTNSSKEYKEQAIFKNDTAKFKNITIQPIEKKNFQSTVINEYKDITISVMLIVVSLYAWIRVYYGKFLNQIILSSIHYHESTRLFKSNNALLIRLYYLLNFLSFIILGFFVSIALKLYRVEVFGLSGYWYLGIGVLLVVLFYLYKTLLSRFLGFLLLKQSLIEEVIHSSFLYLKVLSILILPVVSIIFFVSDTLKNTLVASSILVFVTCTILILYRSVRIFISKGFSFFYTMLYLCIIEILPLLIVIKLISK